MTSKKLILAPALLLGATSVTLAMSPQHLPGYSSDTSYGAGGPGFLSLPHRASLSRTAERLSCTSLLA